MKKPRLLLLTTRPPYPLHGGDVLRLFRLAESLATQFDIELVAMCEDRQSLPDSTMQAIHAPAGPFATSEFVTISRGKSVVQALAALPMSKAPMQVTYYRSREFASRVREKASRCDAVFCHLIRTAQYAEGLSLPKALEYTDALSLFYDRVTRASYASRSLKSVAYTIEQPRVLAYELRMAQRFDLLTFASDVDRRWLIERAPPIAHKAIAAPNGVKIEPWRAPATEPSNHIAYIGNMRTLQNMDAAVFFASEILPLLLERHPDTRLQIIGSVPDRARARLEKLRNVDVLGVVEQLEPVLRRCFAGVCPMRLGAGIQNKVLDYMSHSLPVVSTTLGVAGLGAHRGDEPCFLRADSPAAFAAHLDQLHGDPVLRTRVAAAGHRLVRERFDWQTNLQPIVDALYALV